MSRSWPPRSNGPNHINCYNFQLIWARRMRRSHCEDENHLMSDTCLSIDVKVKSTISKWCKLHNQPELLTHFSLVDETIILDQNIFLTNKYFDPKNILVPETLWSQNHSIQKHFCPKNIFAKKTF